MGCPKKPLEGKEKEAAYVYALLQAIPSTWFSLSLPDILRSKGFTEQQSNNPGLQKRVQCGAGCKETHAAVVEAVLAAAAHITKHTIPDAIATDSNTDLTVSSLSDEGSPTQTNAKHQHRNQETLHQRSFNLLHIRCCCNAVPIFRKTPRMKQSRLQQMKLN